MISRLLPLFFLLGVCSSLNVLVFLLGTVQQERANMELIAQQLALRHHTVITVKPILIPEEPRLVKPKLHLVREKQLKNLLPRKLYQPLEKAYNGVWKERYDYDAYLEPYYAAHNMSCARMLNSDLIDGLKKDALDVAIVYAGNPCQLAIAHVLGVPVIYFDEEGLTDETLIAANAPIDLSIPLSHCRLSTLSSNPVASRLGSSVCLLSEIVAQSAIPILSSIVSKRFPNFPNVNTLKQQVSVYMANTDPLLEYQRSLPSHVIPVGGLHLDHPRPLFSPWNDTITTSKQGTIIVSFGTHINNSAITASQTAALYGALSQLSDYRIIWSIGPSLSLPGINVSTTSSHINITAYMPQNDLLADKRTKLLVTNGGPNSLMEAIAYGVPVVGIPLYGVNKHNLDKAKFAQVTHKGMGIVVQKNELSQTNLLRAMKSVLESSKYKTVAKDMSKEFKTRQQMGSVLERVVHLIEHVGRHHGYAFFRQNNNGLFNIVRVMSLEMAFYLFLIFGAPLFLSYVIFTKSLAVIFSHRTYHPLPSKPVEATNPNPVKSSKSKAK